MTCLNSNAGGTRWCAEQQALPMAPQGRVMRSRRSNPAIASAALWPHMSGVGRKELHTAGRSGRPNKRQRNCSSSCTHGTPDGLPSGMPGMGELMDGAMQQAAQWGRQSIGRPGAADQAGRRPALQPGSNLEREPEIHLGGRLAPSDAPVVQGWLLQDDEDVGGRDAQGTEALDDRAIQRSFGLQ